MVALSKCNGHTPLLGWTVTILKCIKRQQNQAVQRQLGEVAFDGARDLIYFNMVIKNLANETAWCGRPPVTRDIDGIVTHIGRQSYPR